MSEMLSYCRYVIPALGRVKTQELPKFHVDDLFMEFSVVEGELAGLIITFESVKPTEAERVAHVHDSLWVYEPRAKELEEIVLQIASGISMFTDVSVKLPFESRRVEFFEKGHKPYISIDLGGTGQKPREIGQSQLIRSVLAACVNRKHDPALTFYRRGATDAQEHRYIEAFYNFFFFVEYLFGNGKSGKNAIVAEFLNQELLVNGVKNIITQRQFASAVSPTFADKVCGMSIKELLTYIVDTRGALHHPNKCRSPSWHPERQREFDEVATLLQFVCLDIATTRFIESALSPRVESAFRKAEHCVRRGGVIRVVTR